MFGLSYFIWCIIILIIIITWGLPKIISWLLCRILDADVKVGRFSLIPLCLKDIHIAKHNFTVIIDSIGVSSNLVNSSYRKILAVYISDVRIEKEVSPYMQFSEEDGANISARSVSNKFTIPPQIVSLSQVTSIHVYNINIMFIKLLQKCLLHATIKEFEMQGFTDQNPSCMQANLLINQFSCKVLHHVNESSSQSCLSEIGFSCNFVVTIDPKDDLKLKSLTICIKPDLDVFLSEGLFNFLLLSSQSPSFKDKEYSDEENHQLYKFLPKKFDFILESSRFKIVNENEKSCFFLTTKKLVIDWHNSTQSSHLTELNHELEGNLSLEDVNFISGVKRIATMNRFEIKLKLLPQSVDIFVILSTFSCLYYHDGVLRFIKAITKWKPPKPIEEKPENKNRWHPIINSLIGYRERKFTIEVWNVVTIFNVKANSSFGIGFTHARLCWEGSKINSKDDQINCYNYNGLLESLWGHIGDQPLPDNPNKKHHYWNTPVFLGVLLFEAKSSHRTNVPKIESMVDCFHLEWSPALHGLLLDIHNGVKHLRDEFKVIEIGGNESVASTSIKSKSGFKCDGNIHVALTNTNVFASCCEKIMFLLRIDNSNLETQQEDFNLSLEGTKLIKVVNAAGSPFPCLKSIELKNSIFNMVNFSANYRQAQQKLSLIIKQHIQFEWTTTTHMAAYSIFKELQILKSEMFASVKSSYDLTPTAAPRRSHKLILSLSVNGLTELSITLSFYHKMRLKINQFAIEKSQKSMTITSDESVLEMDGHKVLTFTQPKICNIAQIREERQSFDFLHLKENKAWSFVFPSIIVQFPHKYNFAESFSEKAISIMKWLKNVHNMKKQNEEVPGTLPCDLLIKIHEISIEICDDIFEIKLRDNYELLEDEFHESEKRWKMLDAKVEELRKTHLHLPAAKVEELYQNLAQRNANIYVKRSRQLYGSAASRSQLFLTRGSHIEILALADPTMHGRDNIVSHMKTIDAESPWPEEEPIFTTLWCRIIEFSASELNCHLRDYPLPVFSTKNYIAWGKLIGAEQAPNKRGKRVVTIEIDEPWGNDIVERSLQPLKFFHDFSCDVEHLTMGNGPCWEPCMAEYGLATDLISKPSSDPSPPLPFWDKIRLLFHGRLTMLVQKLTMVLHSSSNPYNTTEEMDCTWTDLAYDWTNGRFVLKGNLDIYVRTASKYDDCHLMHFPTMKLNVKLDWQCLGDPNDHHAVKPCAPDKLPEYSSNQKHDSYRAFRSNNLNLAIAIDVKTSPESEDIPCMLFYNNTLKWLENLKVIMSGVTRPIRRGHVFGPRKPRKITLSRHYKSIRFSLSLQQFEICYWMSFAKQRGFRLHAKKLTLSSEYNVNLIPIMDGLKHRPQAVYSVVYLNCELNDGEAWLQSTSSEDNINEMNVSFRAPVEKNYLLSVSKLSYGREASSGRTIGNSPDVPDTPHHRLVVYDLKGSWTKNNRTNVFILFDSFIKNKLLRHNLSTEALKGFRSDQTSSSPLKSKSSQNSSGTTTSSPIAPTAATTSASPLSRIQTGLAINMLQKLIAETDQNIVVFSEDLSGTVKEQVLHGVAACQTDDVLFRNWLIELTNCQVLLKGFESPGYVIMSAARAQILQRIHQPVWKDRSLVSKTTWVGSFECMQYYGTIEQGSVDNIQWLSLENIEEKDSTVISNLVDLVGSGRGVGGVVSDTVGVGGISENNAGDQLQRIVSRCGCQFFYASYGDSLDTNNFDAIPPIPPEDSEIWKKDVAVDSFTLTHHDLNCCTNSVQYSMLLDIVNNLLLYVEPGKKEALERYQRLQFQLQLSSIEDQRKPILLLQNNLRLLMSSLRRLEKEIYMVQKSLDIDSQDEGLVKQIEMLENQVFDNKVQINAQAEELAMMISCFKEKHILANRNLKTTKNQQVPLRRRIEVCFRHAQWRLTEADGQLGIADVVLSNFLYSKVMKVDDSAEHLLELGYLKVSNGLPNQIYKDVLQPTDLKGNIPIDRQCALRMFCREKAPVGGISIKEHFEVNIVPMTLRLTHQFFTTMMKFCFQERASNTDGGITGSESQEDFDSETASISSNSSSGIRASRRKQQQQHKRIQKSEDDIEKMKERAEKNKMFLYIKIPEVPIRVSYKGEKEKNIEDVHDFNLVLPTLEYHNVTWTWLDLLLAMKNDSKKALLSQAIKHKLQIKSRMSNDDDGTLTPQEEDKARLLMGTLLTGNADKSKKHHMFGKLSKPESKPF